jgi:formylglycine-generating enzyme required for sulfatase activity
MKRYHLLILLLVFPLTNCNKSNQEKEPLQSTVEAQRALLNHQDIKNMVLIPAGEFLMGSEDAEAQPDEQPVHQVFLPAYYIDRYEVTNMHYQRFVLATGRPAPFVDRPWAEPYNWKGSAYPEGKGTCPVVLVSWEDAQAYAGWIGKRLPTEAEWEKAARGVLARKKFPYGDTLEMSNANYNKGFLRDKGMKPVGSFEPNSFGLYDMAGNVWEWCRDWYEDTYYKNSLKQEPPGPLEGMYRVCRGGSWVNDTNFLRCSQRGKNAPDSRSHVTGFRCALSAAAAKPAP